ncbi:MAG TPA: hypothetical protein PLK94_01515 [Alphaproteobacteria bacterium]|nr:hypothetical protein [Alphaproteobacteria bacterium]
MTIQRKAPSFPQDNSIPAPYAQLFKAFQTHKILWCSWKSNEHLIEGLLGKTDIDIIFEEHERRRVIEIMRLCGFVIFQAPDHRCYPGIIDAICADCESGRILHAHSHFLLAGGEKYLKNQMLPWNAFILEGRAVSELAPDIYTSSPDVEAVLLLVRESLKIRWRDWRRLRDDEMWGSKGFKAELAWLRERAAVDDVRKSAEKLLNAEIAEFVCELFTQKPTLERFLRLKQCVRAFSSEHGWNRMSPVMALFTVWFREVMYIIIRITEKMRLPSPFIRRRVLPGCGMIVACIGPDGSGKSTVTKTLQAQWQDKIDVVRVYFGTGDGATFFLQRLLKLFIRAGLKTKELLKPQHKNFATEVKTVDASSTRPSYTASPVKLAEAVVGVLAKKQLMRRICRLRHKGILVICDRWPQNQIPEINDGPLLARFKDSNRWLYRHLAHWEEKQFFQICSMQAPDILVRLNPSVDIAVGRKEENKKIVALIAQKIDAFKKLDFWDAGEVHDIDADDQLNEVLYQTREIIWGHLQKRPISRPDFYECFGLPGSGKTTVCKDIYTRAVLGGVTDIFEARPFTFFQKAQLTVYSLFSDFVVYFLLAKLCFDMNIRDREALNYLFRLPVQKLRLKNAVNEKRYLIEQLFLQNIWSAFICAKITEVKPATLSPLIQYFYRDLDGAFLYFDTTPEIVSARIAKRIDGTSRFDGMDARDIEERFRGCGAGSLMDDIATAALFAGLDVYVVDASGSVHLILEKVLDLIVPISAIEVADTGQSA